MYMHMHTHTNTLTQIRMLVGYQVSGKKKELEERVKLNLHKELAGLGFSKERKEEMGE